MGVLHLDELGAKADALAGASLAVAGTQDYCVHRAVDDLARHVPQERVYEMYVNEDIEQEEITVLDDAWVDLSSKHIKWQSETVVDAATEAITYVRGTDYVMDYTNGRIDIGSTYSYLLESSGLSDEDALLITYKLDKICAPTSLLTNFLRVIKVEYPVGSMPQTFVSFEQFADMILISAGEGGSDQASMSEKRHVAIYYHSYYSYPTDEC